MYSVITTVTEFTVTSRVCAVDRSTFFRRANFFCLCFDPRPLLLPPLPPPPPLPLLRCIFEEDDVDEELLEPGLW